MSRAELEIFDVYLVDEGGRLATRLRGTKEARPRLDLILQALRDLEAGVAAPAERVATEADETGGTSIPAARTAGILEPRWMWSHDAVRPGDALLLALMFVVQPGWHVYAPGAGDLTALDVQLELPKGLRLEGPVAYPPPETLDDPVLGLRLPVWSGDVPLDTLRLVAADDLEPGRLQVRVRVTWQACDARTCRPPETTELVLEIDALPREARRGQVFGWESW